MLGDKISQYPAVMGRKLHSSHVCSPQLITSLSTQNELHAEVTTKENTQWVMGNRHGDISDGKIGAVILLMI